ncbi:MAG: aminopeptidase N C-terminal domain-containing protein, partial [Henriciella sp.]
YDRWKDNELVIDKWFGVQAATGTTDEVAALLKHPAFDLGNPNRVRSVIGVYSHQNLSKFHASDGQGYALVADIILKADKLNPALAARLLQAFEQWRSLEPEARASAEATLKALQSNDLSSNTNDILSRTLG